jgi:hypothetical protein
MGTAFLSLSPDKLSISKWRSDMDRKTVTKAPKGVDTAFNMYKVNLLFLLALRISLVISS